MWTYKGTKIKSHEDLLPGCTDIVYEITFTNGRKYIGKKTVAAKRRKKPTKKQLAQRKNYARIEWTKLPFLKYQGSSELTAGLKVATKEILYQTKGKTTATYLEVALLIHYAALFDDMYINKNISGKFFDSALDGLLGENDG